MIVDRIKWYYQRARTISLAEWAYRLNQQFSVQKAKLLPSTPTGKLLKTTLPPNFKFDASKISAFKHNDVFNFFNYSVDISKPIDFHKEIAVDKSFPQTFSKTIDTRSNTYGSAKIVWEPNRLQFLIPLLIEYRQTSNPVLLKQFVSIMTSWAEQNPYLKGVNWYSNIEVNTRLINWYWCWLILEDDVRWQEEKQNRDFVNNTWLPLIYQHCYYSYSYPSYYSSANNHLISEYAGLYIATSLWQFKESKKWQQYAKDGLEKEIILQHSAKGVNKEQAAEYIQFITDFFLLSEITANHYNTSFSKTYNEMLINIVDYIYNFLDVKGNFPRYGDEDDGRVILPDGDAHTNNFASILNTAAILFDKPHWHRLKVSPDIKTELLTMHFDTSKSTHTLNSTPLSSKFYKEEGHFYFKSTDEKGKEIYAHFNAAPLGFLSIAAHGHSDALSFLLHLDGYPVFVDPGTYTYYESKEWRKYFVSSNVHNTLTFAGKDQAVRAGAMMWLKHYDCEISLAEQDSVTEKVSASHNGYSSLNSKHKRTVEFNKTTQVFNFADEITAGTEVTEVLMHWHLHSLASVTQLSGQPNTFIITHRNTDAKAILTLPENAAKITIDDGWFSGSYMKMSPCKVINCLFDTHSAKNQTLQTSIKIQY